MSDAKFALDRGSVRSVDADGHMRVASSVVSAAQVNPYRAEEIPDWQGLGLKAGETYQLYRDADELEKAAATLHGKPLLIIHRPQTADDHNHEITVGSVSNPVWEAPNLRAELTIWDGEAIAAISSGELRDLSAGYRYRPLMESGEYNGVRYDGKMVDLHFNHIALVAEGRVAGAFVGDAALSTENPTMTKLKGKAAAARLAIMAAIAPKLATDAKYDPSPLFAKVNAKNFKASRPDIVKGVAAGLKDLLAKDASIDTDDLEKILDVVEAIAPEEDDPDYVSDADGDLRAFLKGKGMSEDDITKACAMRGGASDEKDDDDSTASDEKDDDEDKDDDKKKKAADKQAKDKQAKDKQAKDKDDDKMKDGVTKSAMDAAIAAAVRNATETANKTQQEIRDAERDVRAHVGDLAMAHDSAEAVYRTALTTLGEDAKDVSDLPLKALKAILKRIPVPGAKQPNQQTKFASDAASSKGFLERYPDAARIRIQ